jgi:ribonuclease HIII
MATAPPSSFTFSLDQAQTANLRKLLDKRGFFFREVPHALFAATDSRIQVVAYESGKCVIQGKNARDFVEFTLEPEILGEARLGYETLHHPERYTPHIGVDESGKGDFFGPLVIAGVFATAEAIAGFEALGVRDSKSIGSDQKIFDIAANLKKTPGVEVEIIAIGPPKYNTMQRTMGSVNEVLAWGHATVIENLLARCPCDRAVADQFARTESTIRRHLKTRGRAIRLEQRHKAESDPVVAAASILARARFVQALRQLGLEAGRKILPGASAQVKELARTLLAEKGNPFVARMVKTHFKTWREIGGLTTGPEE